MNETRIVKCGCPICKGDSFEQYHVEQPNRLGGTGMSNAFSYGVKKCKACGWQSAPFEEEAARAHAGWAFEIATTLPKDRPALREKYPEKFFIELSHSFDTTTREKE